LRFRVGRDLFPPEPTDLIEAGGHKAHLYTSNQRSRTYP
jgi:hypothetical protein